MADLLWLSDLDIGGAETQTDQDELVQDVFHVIEQDLGSNLDDLTRGVGVANILSKALPSGLATAASVELQKDDRVQRCDAVVGTDAIGNPVLDVTVYTNDDVLSIPVPVGTVQPAAVAH